MLNLSSQTNYPPKYYLALKSSDSTIWQEKWQTMFWEIKDRYNHIKFEKFPESLENDRGKLFKLYQDSIKVASNNNIEKANILILPGTVTSHRSFMHRDFRVIKQYLDIVSKKSNLTNNSFNPLMFCSYTTNYNRYQEAILHDTYKTLDRQYFSPSIQKFTYNYVIPKLLNSQKFVLLAHSVGGKEVYMVENAAKRILSKDYKFSQKEITKIFDNVRAVLYGYAPNISKPSEGFKKLIVLSSSDQGILIPRSLHSSIYKEKYCKKDFSILKFKNNEDILFLGHSSSLEVFDNQFNRDGHRLPHYLHSVEHLPGEVQDYLYKFFLHTIE